MNFTALVVVGNGDGVVGFATGKGKDVAMAVEKAYSRASRSLVYIERFENSTIFHEQEAKHCKTKIVLMPAKAGTGFGATKSWRASARVSATRAMFDPTRYTPKLRARFAA